MTGLNPVPASASLKLYSKSCKFSKTNTEIYNYGNNGNISFLENGSIELNIDSPFFSMNELIKLKENVPLNTTKNTNTVFKNVKKELDSEYGLSMKKQDVLVLAIILVITIMYLVIDLYRFCKRN